MISVASNVVQGLHSQKSSILNASLSVCSEDNTTANQTKHRKYKDDKAFSSLTTAVLELPQRINSAEQFKRTNNFSSELAPIIEASRHLLQPNGSILGEAVKSALLPLFPTFASAIPIKKAPFFSHQKLENNAPTCNNGERAAIAGTDTREPISHATIHSFVVEEFGPKLHELGFGRGDRIALVLPNGPELALAILCTVHWASCVPLNAFSSLTELTTDLKSCGATLVIGLTGRGAGDMAYQHIKNTADNLDIPFVALEPSTRQCGIFTLHVPSNMIISRKHKKLLMQKVSLLPERLTHPSHPSEADILVGAPLDDPFCKKQSDLDFISPNGHNDEVLVLFTSGTTGSKKMVCHLFGDMLVATAAISLSWNLTADDVNCNLMPLFHVGGIVRQVFCPILSGGCVICCPSFDPVQFWSLLEQKKFNWYYAAPTMHQMILQTRKEKKLAPCKLRMIANAAGGLLPSMARELRDTFQAYILPSYGMTECMPISSPPWNYNLERPGTSGLSVGPEIAILNWETNSKMPLLTEGSICVRGSPCFHGYSPTLQDDNFEGKTSVNDDGWFNTGDLGYLDKEGYLYVTGRSKEVINRGGEIISPLEIEEAVTLHPDIESAIAFSVEHDFLQEVVGIAVVSTQNRPRLDLQSLHEYLSDNKLTVSKWPQCLVFMNGGLPKSNTNKLIRIKLAERLGLPVLNDNMHPVERMFEAVCPAHGTELNMPIPSWPVAVDARAIQDSLVKEIKENSPSQLSHSNSELSIVPHKDRKGQVVCYIKNMDVKAVLEVAEKFLHRYEVPSFFVLVETLSSRDLLPLPTEQHSVKAIKRELLGRPAVSDELIMELQEIFKKLLDLDYEPQPEDNFFNLGGSSMLASKLAATLRQKYKIGFNGIDVFHHGSCVAIANLVSEQRDLMESWGCSMPRSLKNSQENRTYKLTAIGSGLHTDLCDEPLIQFGSEMSDFYDSQSRVLPNHPGYCVMLFQCIPLLILLPFYMLLRYILLLGSLLVLLGSERQSEQKWLTLIAALYLFNILMSTISPLLFIIIKWSVIGQYKPGRYPVFGSYYLRWWFVDICRKYLGRGIFASTNWSLNFYYRLLGANIGQGANISPSTEIAEYDLVTIGHGTALDQCVFRGFGVDNGCMILGPVGIRDKSSVGTKSIIAPHTFLLGGIHLGPQMSSYDVTTEKCVQASNAQYNRMTFTQPNFASKFVGKVILALVQLTSQLPTLILWCMLLTINWHQNQKFDSIGHGLQWLCDLHRIPLYLGIRYSRKLLEPIMYILAAIIVKRTLIGKFQPGPRSNSQYQLMRYWLAAKLFSRDRIQSVTDLIGRHFELVSIMYRLLGASVGKRVFWPGTHIEFDGLYDLLEIGDDVVFGSRTTIMSSASDRLEKVRVCAGANVADNCVVLPGATIGKNAVLGAYGLCPAGKHLPETSVWFGSKAGEPVELEKGVGFEPVNFLGKKLSRRTLEEGHVNASWGEGDESTLKPFGKAYYKRDATYYVLPIPLIFLITLTVNLLICTIHAAPLICSIHFTAGTLYGFNFLNRNYSVEHNSTTFFLLLFAFYGAVHFLVVMVWAVTEVCAKWLLMGQRKAGSYNWDKSSYNQRWEILQLIQKIRNLAGSTVQDFIRGSPFLTLLFRLQGCNIGRDCCLWPTGGDPFPPEVDLLTIGDRCVIDDGRLVCHLNTKGNFELTPIVLENDVTLRRMSKIQKGAQVESGAMVLEHSLVMTGETIEANSVWQGAPAICVRAVEELNVKPITTAGIISDSSANKNVICNKV